MAQVVDHKEPIIYGGKVLDEANCQPMCEDCNKAKAAQDKQKYEAKGIAPLWGAGSKQTAIKP
jgi:5-methylcytosine-specific restriction endonuclease McrA